MPPILTSAPLSVLFLMPSDNLLKVIQTTKKYKIEAIKNTGLHSNARNSPYSHPTLQSN